jgi:NADH-quinone oxidoreductase subunit J
MVKKYLPFGLVIIGILVTIVSIATGVKHFALAAAKPYHFPADYSNIDAIGSVLYTEYFYAFELASVILLAAIIAAIALAFRGRMPGTRHQRISKQIATRREDVINTIAMDSERRKS